jgi:hypothetical protein
MFTLSFERLRRVLCLKFTGLLTNEDLDAIDPALVCVAGAQSAASPAVRCLYDMSEIQAIAVPQSRFIERASKPAIGDLMRIVVAPPWAGEGFGASYCSARSMWSYAQPIIVATLADAYALLDIVVPCFEPLPTPAR